MQAICNPETTYQTCLDRVDYKRATFGNLHYEFFYRPKCICSYWIYTSIKSESRINSVVFKITNLNPETDGHYGLWNSQSQKE